MVRALCWSGLFVLLATTATAAPPEEVDAKKPVTDLIAELAKPVSVERIADNTPFQDVLDWINGGQKLTIVVDQEAFKADGIQDVFGAPVRLPLRPTGRCIQHTR